MYRSKRGESGKYDEEEPVMSAEKHREEKENVEEVHSDSET